MSEVYASCVDQLLVNLARHFKFIADGSTIPGVWDYQVRKLAEMDAVTRESEAIILSMLGDADESLQGLLEEAIRNGLNGAEPALKKAAEKGLTNGVETPNIAPRQMQAFQTYYAQSADKLNLVNTVMLESTEQAYAATVAEIATKISNTQGILNTSTGQIITGVDSFNKVQRQAVRRMVDNGLTGFIDHGGHHWSPEAYVAMDMRTTMTNTARQAVWEQSDAVGCELYQVSWHDGARPLCYPWQGKVISRNGWTGTVEDGEGNKVQVHSEDEIESFRYGGGLFGVNCGHYPIPFFPGFSRSRPPKQDEEENAKEYAESQQQRALERNVRAEKRELEVMKAQGATKEEIDAQKLRVRNADAQLTEFCDKTGRARQPGRTSTPINATFPENNIYNSETLEMQRRLKKGRIEEPFAFQPAESVADAEKFAETFVDRSTFGSPGISYKGVSVETANQVNKQLAGFVNTFDVDKFGGVVAPAKNTILGRTVENANAAYNRVNRAMLLNRETLKTPATIAAHIAEENRLVKMFIKDPSSVVVTNTRVLRILEASRKSGRATVADTLEDIINHELGHALQDRLKYAPNYNTILLDWEKYAARISGYATENIGEFVAESFSAWQKGERIWGELRNAFLSCLR